MRKILLIIFLFLFLNPAKASFAPEFEISQMFLEAMGGSEVWKEARFVRNWAVNWNPERRPGPYSHEYWIGLDTMRQHITLQSQWVDLVVAYNEDQGWMRDDGVLTPMDADTLAEWHHDWETSLYRKIYLLSIQDPKLGLELDQDWVLHFTYDGDYLGWIEIGDEGAPVRLGGSRDKERFVTFEPLVKFDQVSWPSGGYDQSGWRFEILTVELAQDAPVNFSQADN